MLLLVAFLTLDNSNGLVDLMERTQSKGVFCIILYKLFVLYKLLTGIILTKFVVFCSTSVAKSVAVAKGIVAAFPDLADRSDCPWVSTGPLIPCHYLTCCITNVIFLFLFFLAIMV